MHSLFLESVHGDRLPSAIKVFLPFVVKFSANSCIRLKIILVFIIHIAIKIYLILCFLEFCYVSGHLILCINTLMLFFLRFYHSFLEEWIYSLSLLRFFYHFLSHREVNKIRFIV